ncbi:MAG: TolC family outer membrane protein [Gammaproteobacteria bacterium]
MKKINFVTSLIASLMFVSTCQAESLLEVYQMALQNDPAIREAEANRSATLQRKPQARGLLLPQVDFSGNWSDTTSEGLRNTTFGGVNVATQFETQQDGWAWSVDVSQTLFRWDQWVSLQRSSKQVAQAEADYLAAGQDLMIRVATRYFDVLATQDTLESEQAAKEAIARQLEQAKKRFEVGLIAITDVQEAQAGYDEAVAAEILAKRNLANAKESLREVAGYFEGPLVSPENEIPLVPPQPADEEVWVETALRQNATVLSSQLGSEIARDDMRVTRTGHFPTVDLVASVGDTDVSGTGDFVGGGGAATSSPVGQDSSTEQIQIRFAVPIFSGFNQSAQVKESVYRHIAAKERYERAARQAKRETRDAFLGVTTDIARVKALRQALASSQTALEASEAGFDVGTRTTVDVLIARRQLFAADVNYARSRYDYILNVLALKQAAGTLGVNDLAEVNGWLEQAAVQ